jgi:hypothetical protein
MKAYENESIFQGIVEYKDSIGNEWRRESRDGIYLFFRKNGNIYIYEGMVRSKFLKTKSIEYVHDKYLDESDDVNEVYYG